MAKLVLDLHDIYNRGEIDRALAQVIQDAIDKRRETSASQPAT